MDVESFGLDIAALHNTLKQGLQTVREFQSPIPDIAIERIDKDTGSFAPVGTINAISIKFGLREGVTTSGNPIPEDFSDGEMKIPADGLIPQVDDVFQWQGYPVEITKVYPPRLFTVVCEIKFSN